MAASSRSQGIHSLASRIEDAVLVGAVVRLSEHHPPSRKLAVEQVQHQPDGIAQAGERVRAHLCEVRHHSV